MRIRVNISSKYLIIPNNQSINENTNWLWSQIAAIQQSGFVKSASMSLQLEKVKKNKKLQKQVTWDLLIVLTALKRKKGSELFCFSSLKPN